MARPRKKIDPQQVRDLARIGCSGDEIAAVLDCSRATIYRRFETLIKEGHEHMKASLRRQQYKGAMAGNATMLVWLGKQILGQKDKNELSGTNGGPIETRVSFEIVGKGNPQTVDS